MYASIACDRIASPCGCVRWLQWRDGEPGRWVQMICRCMRHEG